MDAAYDHIQEQSFPDDDEGQDREQSSQPRNTINADIQEAYRAFSNSPWGARIGGFLGAVAKQGESVYREAQQEVSTLGQEATRGWTDLASTIVQRTRSLSLSTTLQPSSRSGTTSADTDADDDQTTTPTKTMTSDEAIKESETVLSRLKTEAAKRLKDIQKAEEAADEALLRFGSNIRDFLKDAISVTPPSNVPGEQNNMVLFESKDAHGKRVIHTSRFDAQMHVIHTSVEGFLKDPAAAEYKAWGDQFDVEKKTDDISNDLAKYQDLRSTMEKLVPDTVPYTEFWKRYYFLRHGIETAEARRRDLMKAAETEEEVGWDEDSEEDSDTGAGRSRGKPKRPGSTGSSATIHPPPAKGVAQPRKSNDEYSDTSYDIVGAASGKPSQAPSEAANSPKNLQKKADDSDDDDDDEEDDDSEEEEEEEGKGGEGEEEEEEDDDDDDDDEEEEDGDSDSEEDWE